MSRIILNPADVTKIKSQLKGMDRKIKKNMQRDMRKASRPLVGAMKKESPEETKTLRKSIVTRSSKYLDTIDLRIGPRTRGGKFIGWYSHFVELGTKGKRAQPSNPFIKRSWEANKTQITTAVINAIKRYIRF